MRRFYRFGLWCGLATLMAGLVRGDTFTLTDGQTITGEPNSANEDGVRIRLPDDSSASIVTSDGKTVTRIPWIKFSQEDLKKLAANERLHAAAWIEPWIDVPAPVRRREQAFTAKTVERLPRPAPGSFLVGFAGSSVGLTILVLFYLANLYAAYEISIVRAWPWPMVCGLAAIAPGIAPVVFLCLPMHRKTHADEAAELLAAQAAAEQAASLQEAGQPAAPPPESGLGIARADAEKPALPATQTFARGQFTFNRRFFETKFANFFGMIRRESERDLVLVIKTARGRFTVERISRIAANDMHVQVRRGSATEEVPLPFIQVQEVVLKHKDAPD